MCGICGFYDQKRLWVDAPGTLRGMTQTLIHRGPDEEGFLDESPMHLGHRRLAVIDLKGGRQPMTSQDGRVTIVFNGEIYNFADIRSQLEKKGRVFKTRSDTECLLQLYEDMGIGALSELEGMFAVAIWDRTIGKLFLGVDAFGKKPLYYTQSSIGQLIFASELKSLMAHPAVRKEIDQKSLAAYLLFEYVPAPLTILKGVQKLEAGTWLEWSPKGSMLRRYHKHLYRTLDKSKDEWKDTLRDSLEHSVRQRLVSDVPLGVFLSGGLDSSAVLAMVKKILPDKRIKTFTIEFDDASFDESVYARRVSEIFGTEHITEKCTSTQMLQEHEAILSRLDEPLADASFIPTYMLCRLARRHVTVALSGDGGDELFAGYPTFLADEWARRLKIFPKPILKIFEGMVQALPVSMDNLSFDFQVKQFFKGMTYPHQERQQVWLGAFSDKEQIKLLERKSQKLAAYPLQMLRENNGHGLDSLQALQAFYFRFYLQGDILVKVDRASMAHGLEVRSPLLDDALVRQMMQMPSEFKAKGSMTKVLFKEVAQEFLPPDIVHRKKKGFGIPIAKWIRGDLKGAFQESLHPERIAKEGLFNASYVDRLLKQHIAGKRDNRKQLWTLYVFQKWQEKWL